MKKKKKIQNEWLEQMDDVSRVCVCVWEVSVFLL